jgi:hypothetical protein
MCRNCWRGLGLFVAAYFAYFETTAFKVQCHRTLSREIEALGPLAVAAPAVIGALTTWHLLTLTDPVVHSVAPPPWSGPRPSLMEEMHCVD